MKIPKLSPEQIEKAARAMCERRSENPEQAVRLPNKPGPDGYTVDIVRYGHRWELYGDLINDTCDILAVLAETVGPV